MAIAALADEGAKIDAQTVGIKLGQMPWDTTWKALVAMEDNQPIRPSEVPDFSDSALAAVGGHNGVIDLLQGSGFVSGFARNCELLMAYRVQRLMAEALLDGLDRTRQVDGSKNLAQIADKVINQVAGLVMAQEGTATLSDAMRLSLSRGKLGAPMGQDRTAAWGVNALDRAVPLRGGQSVVLAAQPGHGKSSLALQAATATAEILGAGSVAVINLEMPAAQVGRIVLARGIKASARAIETGVLSPDQMAAAEAEIAHRQSQDIYFHAPDERCTVDQVCAWIRQRHVRSAGRLSLVVIDYLQLIDAKGRQTEYDRISEASRALKRIANHLNVCVLLLSQFNRDGSKSERDPSGRVKGNPEPRMQDLRGSGSIEQDADAIVFIWPPYETETPDLPCTLKVAKNRAGGKPRIDAVFERANGQVFREMNSSRAHHAHEPRPSEDAYASMAAEAQTDPQQQEP